ncbi:MAG: AAA family ATPase [Proteobacteria bacterium]|nr:AAA family ATPase [Pseudomonadota bacterium]
MAHKFPIGIQTFERLRNDGYVYVDKTALVYQLAHGSTFNFLARPRRFGKSLLISTLQAYFEGKKALFAGLAMEKLETDWIHYPVLHLDLSGVNYHEEGALEDLLNMHLRRWETVYGKDGDTNPGTRFMSLIERAYQQTRRQVVLLVDEYEKPVLDTIGDPIQQTHIDTLHGFYGCIKPCEKYLKFVLLTGVTKIGKLSVFSALNNLNEITFDHNFTSLCGITEKELHPLFDEDIHNLADANATTFEEATQLLKDRYDGYHFKENTDGIYNPFSLMLALHKREIGDYWFASGTPTYLAELFKKNHYEISAIENTSYSESELNEVDSFNDDVIPLLYQCGYLTLKEYQKEFNNYKLGFPNKEVEKGLLNFFIPFYTGRQPRSAFDVRCFVEDIRSGNAESFLTRLQSLMADVPYDIERDLEVHVQNFCFLLFKLVGYHVHAEYKTNVGRIDIKFETDKYIYIIEFKKDRSAKAALKQIKDKKYFWPFMSDPRKKFLIGMNYNLRLKGAGKFVIETI